MPVTSQPVLALAFLTAQLAFGQVYPRTASGGAAFDQQVATLLNRYCAGCHGAARLLIGRK
jgi:mono/diheme cytochrome c family protein